MNAMPNNTLELAQVRSTYIQACADVRWQIRLDVNSAPNNAYKSTQEL